MKLNKINYKYGWSESPIFKSGTDTDLTDFLKNLCKTDTDTDLKSVSVLYLMYH